MSGQTNTEPHLNAANVVQEEIQNQWDDEEYDHLLVAYTETAMGNMIRATVGRERAVKEGDIARWSVDVAKATVEELLRHRRCQPARQVSTATSSIPEDPEFQG